MVGQEAELEAGEEGGEHLCFVDVCVEGVGQSYVYIYSIYINNYIVYI